MSYKIVDIGFDLSDGHQPYDGLPIQRYKVVHEQSGVKIKTVSNLPYANMLIEELNRPETSFDNLKSASDWTKQAVQKVSEVAYKQIYVRFFASGLGERIELESFYIAGENLGVRALNIRKASKSWGTMTPSIKNFLIALGKKKDYHGFLFIDSGAFQEFNDKTKTYFETPLTSKQFKMVVKVYEEMAKIWGSRLYVVAPDKVADQKGTIKRLKPFLKAFASLKDKYGVNVIVPLQGGKHYSLLQFNDVIQDLCKSVGLRWIRGIPSTQKSPIARNGFVELKTLLDERNFYDIHFLGMSPNNQQFPVIERMLLDSQSTWMSITMDGAIIRSLVGQSARLTLLLKEIQSMFNGNLTELINELWDLQQSTTIGEDGKVQSRFRAERYDPEHGFVGIPFDYYGQLFIDPRIRESFIQTILYKRYLEQVHISPNNAFVFLDFPDSWLKGSFTQKVQGRTAGTTTESGRYKSGKRVTRTFKRYNAEYVPFFPIDIDVVELLEDWLDGGQSRYNADEIKILKSRMNQDYETDEPPFSQWGKIKWDTIRDLYFEWIGEGNTVNFTTLATANDRYMKSPLWNDLLLAQKLDNMLYWYSQQKDLKAGADPAIRQFSYPLAFLKIVSDDGLLSGEETYN